MSESEKVELRGPTKFGNLTNLCKENLFFKSSSQVVNQAINLLKSDFSFGDNREVTVYPSLLLENNTKAHSREDYHGSSRHDAVKV